VLKVSEMVIRESRATRVQPFNEYRKRFNQKPYTSFYDLTGKHNCVTRTVGDLPFANSLLPAVFSFPNRWRRNGPRFRGALWWYRCCGVLPWPPAGAHTCYQSLWREHSGDGCSLLPERPDGKPHLLPWVLEAQHLWGRDGVQYRENFHSEETGVPQHQVVSIRGLPCAPKRGRNQSRETIDWTLMTISIIRISLSMYWLWDIL